MKDDVESRMKRVKDPWLRKQLGVDAGKGDVPRRVDRTRFEEGYDRAFGICSTHETHDPSCVVCRRIKREKENRDGQAGEGGARVQGGE